MWINVEEYTDFKCEKQWAAVLLGNLHHFAGLNALLK